ncbi:hypothetical protein QYF36_012623 [Acer negundo]|nr:hypothetical protein QYF36_012623 [Acer negundo]
MFNQNHKKLLIGIIVDLTNGQDLNTRKIQEPNSLLDQSIPRLLMDKVDASYESHMSSSTNESTECRDDTSSSGNGIPSHSYQVLASLPLVELGIARDSLPPNTPKNNKGNRNRNSTKCHSMRTRNSKVGEDMGEQATKADEAKAEPTQWLQEELDKIIKKVKVFGTWM